MYGPSLITSVSHTAMRVCVAVCGLLLIGGVLAGWWVLSHKPSSSESTEAQGAEHGAFVALIRAKGGAVAYRSFVDTYATKQLDVQHNAAHIFGQALFEVEGVRGVANCTQEFNFGCYHGFMSRAIALEGLSVVEKLDRVCSSDTMAPLACQHGIGHGIMEFMGHTKLLKALEACALTHQQDPIAGCTSGVFMEYNVPLVVRESGALSVEARPLTDSNNPFDVCLTIPSQYQLSCYHELPQWWGQVFTTDMGVMGRECSLVTEESLRSACFAGIANIIPSQAGYRAQTIVTMCTTMPSKSLQQKCLIEASWGLVKNFNLVQEADEVCRHVPEALQYRCPK